MARRGLSVVPETLGVAVAAQAQVHLQAVRKVDIVDQVRRRR